MSLTGLAARLSRSNGWLGRAGFLDGSRAICDDGIGCGWGQNGLELAANEIVHVAQTVSGRLKISQKS